MSDLGLFDGLDQAAGEEVRSQLRPRELAAGAVLCHAGEQSDSLYVVERGLLHVLDGDTGALLGRHRRGDVVGEVSLLTGEPRSATLVAHVPSVVAELSRDAFLAAGTRHPRLLANLATILSRRLVARTAPGESRVTALVTPSSGWEGSAAATAAARAASASPLTVVDRIDATTPVGEVLARIDAAVSAGPVLVAVPAGFEQLAEVLGLCDRTLVIEDPGAGSPGPAGGIPAKARLVDAGTDPARLGRLLARASVGVALGAGGARGWVHVGVLRSLLRAGYVVDAVAGSSLGAWVGAWLALGRDADAIEALMAEVFDDYGAHAIFRQGGPQGTAVMTRAARETTSDVKFDDLDVPLVVLAADLAAQQVAVLDDGAVAQAMVTAVAVPGLYEPVRRASQRLVDAVVLMPVPTEAVPGVDVTVAVNSLARQALDAWPEKGPDSGGGQPHPHRDADPVVESLELSSYGAAAAQTAAAAVPVTPRLGPGTWRDFHLAAQFMAAGELAMEEALPALGALARPSS